MLEECLKRNTQYVNHILLALHVVTLNSLKLYKEKGFNVGLTELTIVIVKDHI